MTAWNSYALGWLCRFIVYFADIANLVMTPKMYAQIVAKPKKNIGYIN